MAALPRYPGEGPRDLSRPLERIRLLVDQKLAGQRLDLALAAVLKWRSRSSIAKLIDAGMVCVSDRRAAASRRVRVGETIVVEVPPNPLAVPDPTVHLHFPILYEDQWMVAVDKPAGLAVHPSGRHLRGTLLHELHRRYRQPGSSSDVVPRLLHRIDIETSGVVAVGLDEQFHHLVARQFEDRRVEKTYLAVVHGRPSPASGTIDLPILPDRSSVVRLKLTTGVPGQGQSAVTDYRLLRSNGRFGLVEVRPRTGRTHQIRVHLAALGAPLVGDKLYGGDETLFLHQISGTLTAAQREALILDRHALHAHSLRFFHPRLGRDVQITAPLPAELAALVPDDR